MIIDGVEYISVQEAADRLGVSAGRIRQIILDGRIERRKVGNTNMVTVDSVQQLINQREQEKREQQP